MNYYYLLSAMLLIILAFFQALHGERKIFADLEKDNLPEGHYCALNVAWHQQTWLLAISGLFTFLASIWTKGLASVMIFILILLIGDLVVLIGLFWRRGDLALITKLALQLILLATATVLILVGLFVG